MKAPQKIKGRIELAAFLAGTLIFLGVIYSLGLKDTWNALLRARFSWFFLTVVFYLAPAYLRIYKWVLMRDRMGSSLTFSELSAAYFSSKFWGTFSPMRSGEVVPAVFRGERHGKLLSIILYDRVVETFQSLIVCVFIFFLFYGTFWGMKSGFALAGIFAGLGVFAFLLLVKEAGERVMGWADAGLALIGGRKLAAALRRFLRGLTGGTDEFYKATRSYFTVGFSTYILFLTFLAWVFDIAFWVVLFRMMNIHTGLLVTAASVMVNFLAAALSPTPGGLGVADMGFAFVLRHFGYIGEAGGIIILSRILTLGYLYIGYALSNLYLKREAKADT